MVDFEVVSLEAADHPESGDEVPDFTRPLVNGEFWEDRSLSALASEADGPTILVFTPMVGSYPGKYVWEELREREWHEQAGRIVGVTISTPYAIKRFLETTDLPFSVFSDPQNGVAAEYGIVNDLDGMAGFAEPRPAVFVLDADLTVETAWVAEEWPEFPPYDELKDELGF